MSAYVRCVHCGKPIHRKNWATGPGWAHDHNPRTALCDPTTIATPPSPDETGATT